MKVWLVGMMGSGKTVAGLMAAEHLGVAFLDIDDEVLADRESSLPELWEEIGEKGFRRLETAAIERAAGADGIVSTGGGALLDRANRYLMKSTGTVIWLKAGPAELAARLDAVGGRPLLDDHPDRAARIAELLKERTEAYSNTADYEIDTSRSSVEEVAMRIVELWRA